MKLGIDLSNITSGGGLTHIVSLLEHMDIQQHGFSKVIVWGGLATLDRLPKHNWLECSHQAFLDKNIFFRRFWQKFYLSGLAKQSCDILFVPGGTYTGRFKPVVAMSQNLLPFEWVEMKRFGFSRALFKNILRHIAQESTFKKAEGIIFLSDYAKKTVMDHLKHKLGNTVVIPHGIDNKFDCSPRDQKNISAYSDEKPFRLLYVSIINVYKHQECVVQAVASLRQKGVPIVLELVGASYAPALRTLNACIDRVDKERKFIRYRGVCEHDALPDIYQSADAFVFASSCENLPIILLEAMFSGLPIASSERGPMPEALRDAGVYFDPESSESILAALDRLILDDTLRAILSKRAYERALQYTWKKSADATLSFLHECGKQSS